MERLTLVVCSLDALLSLTRGQYSLLHMSTHDLKTFSSPSSRMSATRSSWSASNSSVARDKAALKLTVMFLEDQHGPQPHSRLATATDIDADALRLLQHLVAPGAIKRNERALSLATQVNNLARELLRQRLQTSVEIVPDAGRVRDQVQAGDLSVDGAEEEGAAGVAHPGVELAVGLVGAQGRVCVVVAGGLGFLAEGDHVRGVVEVPVLVGPELAGGADAGLDLVDDEEDVVFAGQGPQAAEEVWGGVVVAAFGLDGLGDDGGGFVVVGGEEVLDLVQTALFFFGIFLGVGVEWVFAGREGCLRPVESWNVEFMDWLATGSAETAKKPTVEGSLEGEDAQGFLARGHLVVHRGLFFLGGEFDIGTTSLLLARVHERGFVCELVGIASRCASEDLIEAFGCGGEDTRLEYFSPIMLGEVTQCRTVDQGGDHFGR